jgi:tRNA A37 threonylcarbamoyladenosine dehydratase
MLFSNCTSKTSIVSPQVLRFQGGRTAIDRTFDLNVRFFGEAGQEKLANAAVTVIGAGCMGGHVLQQLALLGIGSISVVDAEELAETNRNRYVTAEAPDPVPERRKLRLPNV